MSPPNDPESTEEARPAPRRADLTAVSEIMSRDVISVGPDLPISALEELFLAKGIGGVPVVDASGTPRGVVSKTDLLRWRGEPNDAGATVEGIMMPTTFFLLESEPIAKASGMMAYEGVHRLPVLDRDNRVVGMVSALDVMRWLAREYGYAIANRR